jgi:hypothetical protein
MKRNQNKFKETEPARQEYQGKERSVNRRSMIRYMVKEQTGLFLIRKVEITIEMFYINKL